MSIAIWVKTWLKIIKPLVRQIVKASEANRPKFRYAAPWWQAWYYQFLRILGN